ncbi:MAG TPA: FliM/FliN family flagellar motor switch protein [Acidobacteriota bacterium]|nr:FliM/FliN family flagellar motor switch protein [Acidobacteriota bacterium]
MSSDNRHSENIQRILDIDLPVTVSFGSAKWPLKEILEMVPGSVLELDRAADDPVVLKINDRPFARGEVVVVDGYYGIKILQIESPENRIHSLGG